MGTLSLEILGSSLEGELGLELRHHLGAGLRSLKAGLAECPGPRGLSPAAPEADGDQVLFLPAAAVTALPAVLVFPIRLTAALATTSAGGLHDPLL